MTRPYMTHPSGATGDLASRQRRRLCHYNRIGVLSHNEGISDLFESVHPDSTVVDAATACEQLLTGVSTELYLNGDQFAALQEVNATVRQLRHRFIILVLSHGNFDIILSFWSYLTATSTSVYHFGPISRLTSL